MSYARIGSAPSSISTFLRESPERTIVRILAMTPTLSTPQYSRPSSIRRRCRFISEESWFTAMKSPGAWIGDFSVGDITEFMPMLSTTMGDRTELIYLCRQRHLPMRDDDDAGFCSLHDAHDFYRASWRHRADRKWHFPSLAWPDSFIPEPASEAILVTVTRHSRVTWGLIYEACLLTALPDNFGQKLDEDIEANAQEQLIARAGAMDVITALVY